MQRLDQDPSDQEWDRFMLRAAHMKDITFQYGYIYDYHRIERMHPQFDDNIFSKIIVRMHSMHNGQILFPRLESLHFKFDHSVGQDRQLNKIQEQLCTANNFGNPTYISFDNVSLPHSTLLAFSKRTSFKTLLIQDDSTYSHQSFRPPKTINFYNLSKVMLFLLKPKQHIAFLNALSNIARLEIIALTGLEMAPTADKLQVLLSALVRTCDNLCLRKLTISMDPYEVSDCETWLELMECVEVSNLEPLASFSNLEYLDISAACTIHGSDINSVAHFIATHLTELNSLGVESVLQRGDCDPEDGYEDWNGVHKKLQVITGKSIQIA